MKLMIATLSLFLAANAFAQGTSTAELSHRAEKKIGLSLSVGNPQPILVGVSGSYNLNDWLRAELAYGSMEVTKSLSFTENGIESETAKITSIAGGMKAFVPGWNFSPTAGLHVASISISGDLDVQGYDSSGTYPYGTVGADWISETGYNVNFGMNVPLGKGSSMGYAGVGYFF